MTTSDRKQRMVANAQRRKSALAAQGRCVICGVEDAPHGKAWPECEYHYQQRRDRRRPKR